MYLLDHQTPKSLKSFDDEHYGPCCRCGGLTAKNLDWQSDIGVKRICATTAR